MSEPASTNWLDVLKASFWPVIALGVLLLFYGPIWRFADHTSERPASSLEIAGIKITFDKEATRNLQRPKPEVERTLLQLNSSGMDALLKSSGMTSASVCPSGERAAYLDKSSTNNPAIATRFISLGIMRRSEVDLRRLQCQGEYLVSLTPLGLEVRTYLVEILTKVVAISPAR
jgi:hypothetical protein